MERSPAAPRSGEEWSMECLQVGRLYSTAYSDTHTSPPPTPLSIPKSKEKDGKNLSTASHSKRCFMQEVGGGWNLGLFFPWSICNYEYSCLHHWHLRARLVPAVPLLLLPVPGHLCATPLCSSHNKARRRCKEWQTRAWFLLVWETGMMLLQNISAVSVRYLF